MTPLACALMVSAAATPPSTYHLDAQASHFTVRVFSAGLLGFLGHEHLIAIRDFSGEVKGDALEMTIEAASIEEASKDFSASDRAQINRTTRDEVLEVTKYPQIVFHGRRTGDTMSGELTLHGCTRPISFPVTVISTHDVPSSNMLASGTFSIQLSDYGIARPSVAAGTVKVDDKVELKFDIVAKR